MIPHRFPLSSNVLGVSRPVAPPGNGAIVSIPHIGGLHHRYEHRAA
jgi:hypothetical protein